VSSFEKTTCVGVIIRQKFVCLKRFGLNCIQLYARRRLFTLKCVTLSRDDLGLDKSN
jgi:hypothetical protein